MHMDLRRTLTVIFILLAGFYAGGQLGKIAPVVLLLREQHGYSLTYLGWLTSLIGLFVAVAALPVAFAIRHYGVRLSLNAGALLLFVGALFLWPTTDQFLALFARGIEAVGYVLVVIAAPAVLNDIAPERLKAPALAIWGGFVPIGYALANYQAAAVLPGFGLSGFYLSMALGYGLFGVLSGVLLSTLPRAQPIAPAAETTQARGGLPARAYWLAGAFGFYVIASLPLFTFLPTYIGLLDDRLALSAAAIALFVPVGNIGTGFLVVGRLRSHTASLTMFALVALALGTAAIFLLDAPSVKLAGAILFSLASGVVGSAVFATLPAIVRDGQSASIAMGAIAQTGGVGTVIGPPIAGFVIEAFGWPGLSIYVVIVCLLGVVCAWKAVERRHERPVGSNS
ncbi:MAG: MFS transporter [Rhizobiaceae bacterium MnEN-MB40S]|nr:MAG: MFS transporter [Rhizobiaceae bacterium MnEN-MB40S]